MKDSAPLYLSVWAPRETPELWLLLSLPGAGVSFIRNEVSDLATRDTGCGSFGNMSPALPRRLQRGPSLSTVHICFCLLYGPQEPEDVLE